MRVERTETTTVARDVLRVTSCIAIGGKVIRPGGLVEVDAIEAGMLIARNVAVRATSAEVAAVAVTSAPRSNITRID